MPKRKATIGRGRARPTKRKRPTSKAFNCPICMDLKPINSMFQAHEPRCCSQSFCTDCITKHVDAKMQDGISTVECPNLDCKVVIDPQICIGLIPKQVFDRWENALSEAMIMASTNRQCPFEDCAVAVVMEEEEEIDETKRKTMTEEEKEKGDECPHCKRLFCGKCNVAWHDGMKCEEFQELGQDEKDNNAILLWKLAKDMRWARCPSCRIYVERIAGCCNMVCRWEEVISKAAIMARTKYHCPFGDCSAAFMSKEDKRSRWFPIGIINWNIINSLKEITKSATKELEETDIHKVKCPHCLRNFCAQCNVAWHHGIKCAENHADLMFKELVQRNKWMKCPRCLFFVERINGCSHMSCRCGCRFCYLCGHERTATYDHFVSCRGGCI